MNDPDADVVPPIRRATADASEPMECTHRAVAVVMQAWPELTASDALAIVRRLRAQFIDDR